MARLIPKIDVDEISNKPERDVAKALITQLSNSVVVYHSYPWLRMERRDRKTEGTLREGEADFVIIIPELGLLVVEVKGGVVVYDSENCLWYRRLPSGKHRDIKDPFRQASVNMHILKEKIVQHAFPGGGQPATSVGCR